MELYIVLCVIVLAMVYVAYNYFKIKKMDEGTAEMAEMAGIIRSGAAEFLKTEFKTITIVVLLVAAVFTLFIEKTSGITFVMGSLMSSAVCILGMSSATTREAIVWALAHAVTSSAEEAPVLMALK